VPCSSTKPSLSATPSLPAKPWVKPCSTAQNCPSQSPATFPLTRANLTDSFKQQLAYQVFLGNLDDAQNVWTACSSAGSALVSRDGASSSGKGRLLPMKRDTSAPINSDARGRLLPKRPTDLQRGADSGPSSNSDPSGSGSNGMGRLPPLVHDAIAVGGGDGGDDSGPGSSGIDTMDSSHGKGRLPPLRRDAAARAPLCSNSAPFTKAVFEDFSAYPTVRVIANGTEFTGVRDHMSFRFMGVPYAQPPVGELRFAYAEPFNGTEVDATVCEYE
jgi:hypothetical protein